MRGRGVQDPITYVRRIPYWGQVVLVAAVYFGAAKLSLFVAIPPGYATAIWPPSGIGLAATLALGNRICPGIWLGAALVNLTVESSLLAAVFIGTGNTLEALAGAALIRRFLGVPYRFEHGEDAVKFIGLAAFGATVAATIGLLPLALRHPLSWQQALSNWWTWWQGDMLGMVVIAPLVLSWSVRELEAPPRSGRLEGVGFSLLLLAMTYAVFGHEARGSLSYQWPFLILLFVIWAAFRFTQRGVTATIAAVCAIAVACTIGNHGPFASASLNDSLLLLLAFITIVSLTGLVLAGVLRERGRNAEEMRRQRDDLESRVQARTLELAQANRALREDVEARKLVEAALFESRQSLAAAQRVAHIGSWELDLDNPGEVDRNRLRWSDQTFRIFGHEPGAIEVSNENFFDAVHPDDRERIRKAVANAINGGELYSIDHRIVRPDGSERVVHEMSAIIRDNATGRPVKMIGTVQDITERKLAESRLHESEARFRLIVDNVVDYAILMLDPQGFIVSWNTGAERIKGYRAEEIIGQHFSRFYLPEDRGLPERALQVAAAEGRFENEGLRLRKDGSTFWANVVITALYDESGTLRGFGKVTRDLSERKRSEERLAYLAQYDTLTKLPNRHMLHDRFVHTLAQIPAGVHVGCLYIDLDRFKDVNDTFGHGVGDELLAQLAARLQQCVRGTDVVGRLGGDEFAVVLSSLARPEDAAAVGQKVIAALALPFKLHGREIYVSASIGIAIYPEDGGDADTLLKNADTAMYVAKEQGRNNYQLYTPKMDERASLRLQLDARLRGALERNEFLLHYQPKVNLATRAISGLEALLRWQDPQEGLISPARFVPILEDNGLIIPVGEWVLQTVCEQIKAWEGAGIKPRPISVNVSARQFQQKQFDAVVSRIIREAGVEPALIRLELTESLLMKDAEETIRILASLKASGVTLSVDDFGTGYSSLAYLQRFPLDELKIDGGFVRDITTEPEDAEITVAIISLAHNLDLRVVAEGVETEAQVLFLRSHGCDEMQGYYFARPQSPEACTRILLEDWHLRLPAEESAAGTTALIVDDNNNDLELMRRILQADGYRVFTAGSAQDAFDVLAKHEIDIVISDQDMPGMDGVRFLTGVRKLYPDALRIVSSGADDFAAVADAVNEAGIHKYLSKTWDATRLTAEIREAQRHRGTSQ
jgi:diguanylate cyclase (GGDEF)-like protein/PAS domain S-box-containing protein